MRVITLILALVIGSADDVVRHSAATSERKPGRWSRFHQVASASSYRSWRS